MSSYTIVSGADLLEIVEGRILRTTNGRSSPRVIELSPVSRIVNYSDGFFYWDEGDNTVVIYDYVYDTRQIISPLFHPYYLHNGSYLSGPIGSQWQFQFETDYYIGKFISENEDELVLVDGNRTVHVNKHTGKEFLPRK